MAKVRDYSKGGRIFTASNGQRYSMVKGLEHIDPIIRMEHTKYCYRSYEVNPVVGCDHLCKYCSMHAQTSEEFTASTVVFEDYPQHLVEFIDSTENPRDLNFYFTGRADAFSPIMIESGMCETIFKIFRDKDVRYFIVTKGAKVPDHILKLLQETSENGSIIISYGMPSEAFERRLEPGAPLGKDRLRFAKHLKENGVTVSGLVGPYLPIDDGRDYANKLFSDFKAAGIEHASIQLLKLTKESLEKMIMLLPEYADRFRKIFDMKYKMELDWKLPGGYDTVERFYVNKEYLKEDMIKLRDVAAEHGITVSTCGEQADLIGVHDYNTAGVKKGWACSGMKLKLAQNRPKNTGIVIGSGTLGAQDSSRASTGGGCLV